MTQAGAVTQISATQPGRKGSEFEILGVPEVLEQWGVERVDQVIDVLGLMGDSSDNVPGVPGVGPKTAKTLIEKFGSIENLLAHTNELKGKQRERIEENAEQALLSKQLVTIQLDVPCEVEWDQLAWKSFDKEALEELFIELEFDVLVRRIFGK